MILEPCGLGEAAGVGAFGAEEATATVSEGAIAECTATEGTGDSTFLYRGVAETHPGYEDALNGVSRPQGGSASALEHNLGNTESPFTSWSTDPSVARSFAGERGVVLRIPNASGAGYTLVPSPDLFGESEVLVQGTVTNATVLLP